jgi:hypothetical protein
MNSEVSRRVVLERARDGDQMATSRQVTLRTGEGYGGEDRLPESILFRRAPRPSMRNAHHGGAVCFVGLRNTLACGALLTSLQKRGGAGSSRPYAEALIQSLLVFASEFVETAMFFIGANLVIPWR